MPSGRGISTDVAVSTMDQCVIGCQYHRRNDGRAHRHITSQHNDAPSSLGHHPSPSLEYAQICSQ